MSLCVNFLDDMMRPSRFFDDMDVDDYVLLPRFTRPPYLRSWRTLAGANDSGSTIKSDETKFQVDLDVQQFAPEEINVKVTGDNTITVEGKHEEKQDEHGYISRHFVRRYVLPEGHDIGQVASKLSSDGVLSIVAPRKQEDGAANGRNIPIVQTGAPSIQNKKK